MNIQAIYGRVTACARAVQNRWFLLAVFLAAFNLVKQRRFFHDDAFIELRYAYNLIHFGQLGWNPGEPIEGFTSVQHLLLVSWLGALNLPLPQAAHMVNFAAYAVALGAAWWALKLGSKGHGSAQAIGWLVMAASAPLVIWVWGGLEAVLACAWVSCAVALVIAGLRGLEGLAQRAAWALFTLAGLCFAMAVSARPDTLMLAVGCAAGLMLTCVRQTPLKAVMLAAAVLMPVALMQGALLYARWEVFHELVPNTYFAKVYGVPLSHRLLTGIRYLMLSMGELPMLPALAIVLALERQLWRERPVVIAACVLLCALASVWWVGGDHMASARFLVPILPVLAWLTASVVMLAPRQALSRTVLLGGMALTVMSPLLRYSLPVDAAAWAGRLVGEYMHQHWSPQSLVALNTAGAPAYFAPEMNYIDMLGLNDHHIARREVPQAVGKMQRLPGHFKGDGAYVLAREPDFIIVGVADGEPVDKSQFLGDMELARLPGFKQCYQLEKVSLPYSAEYARIGYPRTPNPLPFTYYRRTCPKQVQRTADQAAMKPRS